MQRITNALFSDFYELTMAQGYWKEKKEMKASFDMFFRRNPFGSGYSIFAGLWPLLNTIKDFHFANDDIAFLRSLNFFEEGFLSYLSTFKFSGSLFAMQEGSLIFPNEPIIRIEGNIIEALILEGLILNTINFQSLIATKTARIFLSSNKGKIMEFGLRRAQGADGAMSASRAAFIGGAYATSNILAGKEYGIPCLGTMAHSWVMSFENEEEAFRAYSTMYPSSSIFLLDTYDTIKSGIENAIKVGKELQAKGFNFGVRLDSGDIYYLSQYVRKRLDDEGCGKAFISVSNELTEQIIESLVLNKAPIDSWGVGTHLVTGGDEASFTGVYKMSAYKKDKDWKAVMKISNNPAKITTPGIKQVWRLYNKDGSMKADVISLKEETIEKNKPYTFYHPDNEWQLFSFTANEVRPLLKEYIKDGIIIEAEPTLKEIKAFAMSELEALDTTSKRLLNPHIYKVSLTEKTKALKIAVLKEIKERG
ncbi:MAG: nicotinate phosphoribosyltransferase [Treponema sp.]